MTPLGLGVVEMGAKAFEKAMNAANASKIIFVVMLLSQWSCLDSGADLNYILLFGFRSRGYRTASFKLKQLLNSQSADMVHGVGTH